MREQVELLAPAGDEESLRAALRFGADAIYLGGELLQLRAEKAAFSRRRLCDAVQTVHAQQKKLYVTVNSFMKNDEIQPLAEYARFLYDAGADAAIVSDVGAVAVIKKNAPELPVHISTQANCCNSAAAQVYYNMGAERVVLAREMTLEDIAALRAETPPQLELEAFVHGAMCMAYSGRCLISSYMNGRSGNRGECTQPCRWSYYLVEQKRPNEFFEVEENAGVSAVMSSHDLNCIAFLDEIRKAGVCSFKIEGRMKTAYYVSTVVNAYRHRLDGDVPLDLLERELNSVSHRPFGSGFYYNELQKNHFNDGLYHSDCLFVGVVTATTAEGVQVHQRNMFAVGDELEVVTPGRIGGAFIVQGIKDGNMQSVERAKLVGETVTVTADYPVQPGDYLRKRL